MHPHGMRHFKNCHLARMSDGHYCVIRDLGPVKGGKGLKHHEVVVDFTWRAFVRLLPLRCQSACKFDPVSASNFDPFERPVLTIALASSELAGVAETWRARAA